MHSMPHDVTEWTMAGPSHAKLGSKLDTQRTVSTIVFLKCDCYSCHQDYFGERCGEKTMKTQKKDDNDLSKIALAAIIVFVSAISIAAIGIITAIL